MGAQTMTCLPGPLHIGFCPHPSTAPVLTKTVIAQSCSACGIFLLSESMCGVNHHVHIEQNMGI